jgi:hypothetical protein
VLSRETIGNVEAITDQNHQNDHPQLLAEIERSQAHDGRFRLKDQAGAFGWMRFLP